MLRNGKQPTVRRVNTFNEPVKKKKAPSKSGKFFGSMVLWGLILSIVLIAIASSGYGVYSFWVKSKKPNAQYFSACPNSFIQLKTKPQFGLIFDTDGESLNKITMVAPQASSELDSIQIDGHSWFVVYFSNNFTFTQVSEFIRLSKLEKGNIDYCYLLEQLSLTSGIPVEFVIVRDKSKILAASISVSDAESLLLSVKRGAVKEFRESLLPKYKLDDGTNVSVITYTAFQEQFPKFFRIDDVASEQAFVEVYNSTNVDGYASLVARKWSMLGIDVSRINNATYPDKTDDVAVIYVRNEDSYLRTMAVIKSSLPSGPVSVKVGRPSFLVTTGDIVVFLLKR